MADTTGTQHLEKNKRQWNLDGSLKKETYDGPISGSDKAKKENMGEEEEQHHDSSDTAIASQLKTYQPGKQQIRSSSCIHLSTHICLFLGS